MTSSSRTTLVLALLAGLAVGIPVTCGSCVAPPAPVVPVDPAPPPIPPPEPPLPWPDPEPPPFPDPDPEDPPPQPEPPPPIDDLTQFREIEIGAPAAVILTLPTPTSSQTVEGARVIHTWDTRVPRPDGGVVHWEIHVAGGVVVASFAW